MKTRSAFNLALTLACVAMLLAAGGMQFSLLHTDSDGCTIWFDPRCQVAYVTGDEAMKETLVQEQYERRIASRGVDFRAQLRLAQLAAEADLRAADDETDVQDHRGIAQIEHDRELELRYDFLCSAAP